MPRTPPIREIAVQEASRKGGPLPKHPAGNPDATAFFAGYALAAPRHTSQGKVDHKVLAALRAGRERLRAEPGIVVATDPRGQLPSNRFRF